MEHTPLRQRATATRHATIPIDFAPPPASTPPDVQSLDTPPAPPPAAGDIVWFRVCACPIGTWEHLLKQHQTEDGKGAPRLRDMGPGLIRQCVTHAGDAPGDLHPISDDDLAWLTTDAPVFIVDRLLGKIDELTNLERPDPKALLAAARRAASGTPGISG